MKEYKIYRDEEGRLTFFEKGEVQYTVRCNTDASAQAALKMIRKAEKRNRQDGSI